MWPYPWTHVGTPSHLGHMDRVAAPMPSQAHAGAAQEAPDIGQWEGQDVPLVRPSSCNVKGGIPSSRRYLPTYVAPLKPLLSMRVEDPVDEELDPRSRLREYVDSKRKLVAKKLCYAKPTRSSWPLKQGRMGDLSQSKEDLEKKITTW